MHPPYRLLLLVCAVGIAVSHGPTDTTRKIGTLRQVGWNKRSAGLSRIILYRVYRGWWDRAAIVPPYDLLLSKLEDRFEPFIASVGHWRRQWSRCENRQVTDGVWRNDYAKAMKAAEDQQKMLFIYFCDACGDGACNRFKAETLDSPAVRQKLKNYVCVQVPLDAKITVDGHEVRLLDHPAYREMLGRSGIAIVDFRSSDPNLHGLVVSMFPITERLQYTPERMAVILDLPPGTLTQRTLIYAVRIHPEKPASTSGQPDSNLLKEAESQARYQADVHVQGHQQWGTRFQRIIARLPGGLTAREVCAESWPGENLVEAAIECVRCWRLSDGHWSAVRSPSRFFGYDMKRGSNGIWYATGIVGIR
jgi:hypothetical protein